MDLNKLIEDKSLELEFLRNIVRAMLSDVQAINQQIEALQSKDITPLVANTVDAYVSSNIDRFKGKDGSSVDMNVMVSTVRGWLTDNIKPPQPAAPGAKGETGDIGPMPKHEWRGTSLRFEADVGKWGKWIELQGPPGGAGPGVYGAYVREGDGHIIFQLTNGTEIDAGEIQVMSAIEIKNDEGTQLRADSGEVEYSPGLTPMLLTASGPTTVYTAPVDKAFRIYWCNAIPVLRGEEEAPVITINIRDADNNLVDTPHIGGAINKRQLITGPVGGSIEVVLDIAARVPVNFNIEEF